LGSVAVLSLTHPALAQKAGTCTASSGTLNICTPQNSSTVNGPVELSAAANLSGLTLMRVYDTVFGASITLYETPMSAFDTFLYLGSGQHQIIVVAYGSGGTTIQQQSTITVTNGSAGQLCGTPATDATINFCYPTPGLTVGSPVTISGLARWGCCNISHIRLYVDNNAVYDAGNGDVIFTQVALSPGTHNLVGIAWDNQGSYIKNSETFTVTPGSCTPTKSVSFCFPSNNATVPTPVQVTVASSVAGMTLMRLYDNNQPMYQTTSPSINTDLNIGEGLHHLVAVAYDPSGNAYQDERYIRVTGTGSASPCGLPESGQDINICAPAEFSSVASPVTVSAEAVWNGEVISHIRVYMDGADVYDANYQQSVNTQFTLASGGHHMVVTTWDNFGSYTEVARTFFVP
jgi:hypothetical protein